MDAKKLIEVDIGSAPQIERHADFLTGHAPVVPPVHTKTAGLSFGWAAAVFAMSAIAIGVLEIVAAAADQNAAPPSGIVASIGGLLALALVATPMFALTRSRFASVTGLVAGVGVLGFQAECFLGGHTGFLATPFLAVNVAVVGLIAVCGAALAQR